MMIWALLAGFVAAVGGLILGRAWGRAQAMAANERERGQWNAELSVCRARLEERQAEVARVQQQAASLEARLLTSTEEGSSLKQRVRELETNLEAQGQHWADKVRTLNEAREQLVNEFKALSADALKANASSFLELAQQRFQTLGENAKGELEKKQLAFEELVRPVKETLEKLEVKVQLADQQREGSHQALLQQLKGLADAQELVRTEAHKLVQALRTPNVRGRWGEIELKRIVEHAGLTERVSFVEQATYADGERVGRPDLIVKLPNNRAIIVDSKVPLAAYLDSIEAPDEATRAKKLKEHAQALAAKIDEVARRDYGTLVDGAIDLVVLFLPAEGFVRAAFEANADLMELALQRGVTIATPMTLIALLKAVAFGWRQEALAQNAQEVSALGAELFTRLSAFQDHYAKIGRGLESAVRAYNDATGSFESRVLTGARKLKELKVTSETRELPEPKQVEVAVRLPRKSETPSSPRYEGGQTLPLLAAEGS